MGQTHPSHLLLQGYICAPNTLHTPRQLHEASHAHTQLHAVPCIHTQLTQLNAASYSSCASTQLHIPARCSTHLYAAPRTSTQLHVVSVPLRSSTRLHTVPQPPGTSIHLHSGCPSTHNAPLVFLHRDSPYPCISIQSLSTPPCTPSLPWEGSPVPPPTSHNTSSGNYVFTSHLPS